MDCFVPGMHMIYFMQKRGHLCAVARGREMFRHIPDMTPARFDLFYAISGRKLGSMNCSMAEAEIVKLLGLARQTVYETVTRLEELGLVVRKKVLPRVRARRAHNYVVMTDEGLRRFKLALNAAFSERAPLPMAAPAPEEDAPRWWRRPELADPVTPQEQRTVSGLIRGPNGMPTAATAIEEHVLGREVEKIYTEWAWQMIDTETRYRRRARHLLKLDQLYDHYRWAAKIVGNKTHCLYPFAFGEMHC